MNVIFFSRNAGRAHQFDLAKPATLVVIAALALGVLGSAFVLGVQLGRQGGGSAASGELEGWTRLITAQASEVTALKAEVQERVDALALRLGRLDAQLLRLNALGKRLAQMADIERREFDFDTPPASGGPESEQGAGAEIPDLTALIEQFEEKLQLRDAQLAALESVLLARKLEEQIHPDGRPVRAGFISSYFGNRQDPFTGQRAFHAGLDFSSRAGTEVVAVAAGIVSWAGERAGYGQMVEIAHGNGYSTRYAHNEQNLVTVGQTVTRGASIARMGSTGRSTGPHVHFEVLRNGRQVDPLTFIGR